jgi:peroxiredoxin Q/BCP
MIGKFIFLGVLLMANAKAGENLQVGAMAPDFTLSDESGTQHKLSDYRGKTVVVYFYPKNDTPGCTAEACNLRDNYAALQERDIVILGISYDDTTAHRKFKDKHDLPFPLLADTEKEVAELYNAKSFLIGWLVPDRITYIIDAEGKIMAIIDKVKSADHSAQILAAIDAANTTP